MVAADVIGAGYAITAHYKILINPDALGPNSCHGLGGYSPELAAPECIKVVEQRLVRLRSITRIERAAASPGNFAINANLALIKKKVSAENRVSSSPQGWLQEALGINRRR